MTTRRYSYRAVRVERIGKATLYLGDCLEILPTIRADICLTSPPYNLGGFHQMHGGNSAKWEYDEFEDDMPEQDYQAQQVLVVNSIFDSLSGPLFYSHKNRIVDGRLISPLFWMSKTKWTIHQQVVINKGSGANVDKRRFFPVHEVMLVCLKAADDKLDNHACLTDVWNVEQTNRKDVDHPATMPLSMAQKAISAVSGKVVLDPYLGSGTTGIAALGQNREFIGIEKSKKYFDLACRRIENSLRQERLFA